MEQEQWITQQLCVQYSPPVRSYAESPLQNTNEKAGDIASWRGKGDQYKAETGSRGRRGQDSARVTVRVRGWEVTVVIISCSC